MCKASQCLLSCPNMGTLGIAARVWNPPVVWSCDAYVPVSSLTYVTFSSKAKGICHPAMSDGGVDYKNH